MFDMKFMKMKDIVGMMGTLFTLVYDLDKEDHYQVHLENITTELPVSG